MGVSRGLDGSVIAVLARCGSTVDTVWLMRDTPGTSQRFAEYRLTDSKSRQIVVRIDGPEQPDGATRDRDTVDLDPTQSYSLWGVSSDNKTNSEAVSFTLGAVQALKVGTVMYANQQGGASVVDEADKFTATAC